LSWGSPVEIERRLRIRVALWAFAYELRSDSLVDDATFDAAARAIDLTIATGRPDLDAWFRENFDPSTGSWVWRHPEVGKLSTLYRTLKETP